MVPSLSDSIVALRCDTSVNSLLTGGVETGLRLLGEVVDEIA
jgi:hypothetical protein